MILSTFFSWISRDKSTSPSPPRGTCHGKEGITRSMLHAIKPASHCHCHSRSVCIFSIYLSSFCSEARCLMALAAESGLTMTRLPEYTRSPAASCTTNHNSSELIVVDTPRSQPSSDSWDRHILQSDFIHCYQAPGPGSPLGSRPSTGKCSTIAARTSRPRPQHPAEPPCGSSYRCACLCFTSTGTLPGILRLKRRNVHTTYIHSEMAS